MLSLIVEFEISENDDFKWSSSLPYLFKYDTLETQGIQIVHHQDVSNFLQVRIMKGYLFLKGTFGFLGWVLFQHRIRTSWMLV